MFIPLFTLSFSKIFMVKLQRTEHELAVKMKKCISSP